LTGSDPSVITISLQWDGHYASSYIKFLV
jgi:hypothetical protein